MDKNDNSKSAISTGMISLITFFTILLLASFSVLIITSTRNESELANRAADTVVTYYQADSYAEQRVMEVDENFIEAEFNLSETADALSVANLGYAISEEADALYIEYSVDVDENRILAVKLKLTDDGEIKREVWQLMPKTY